MRVGVLGCGYISQARHLPMIRQIDGIRLEALCDLSRGTLDLVADYYDVTKRYTSYADMLDDDDVDAIAVLSFDHAPDIISALRAGKHVFTEKPLAFTVEEGEQIVELLRSNPSVVLQVGYQKLHDPAVLWMEQRIRSSDVVPRMIEIHDYTASLARTRGEFDPIFRVDDISIPDDAAVRSYVGNAEAPRVHPVVAAKIASSLGPGREHLVDTYLYGLMLGCHDLGILTLCYGAPQEVRFAQVTGFKRLQAVLEMGNGAPCTVDLQLGADYSWWDERFTVYDDHEQVDLRFGNPFLAFTPTEVIRRSTAADGSRELTSAIHGYEDGFRNEWSHFRDSVAGLKPVRATADLALTDIQTVARIVAAIDPQWVPADTK